METVLLIIGLIIIVLLAVVIILLLRRDKNNINITKELSDGRKEQLEQLSLMQTNIQSTLFQNFDHINDTVDKRLTSIQGVVDEKLQKTLNDRLSQSFELVSKQLESVGRGLGEMKTLAADAKSLKNALTNVKDRGTYGEVRLEKLLEDTLAAGQFVKNAQIDDRKIVEFAVKLPGNGDKPLLLPIDSKFPIEDYNRLLDAEDKAAIEAARKSLTAKIKTFAKDIHDKYILPPKTTDFALMFLPTEGLYAEVIRDAALFEELRVKYKVTPVGQATLSAFLSSLQIGFKTLAIEKRSLEIAATLGRVKSEFEKFETYLKKARDQLQTADKTLETLVSTRTGAINRALRTVEVIEESVETVYE
ncbi:MAG: DNA recombination protein RmuC [Ruminococcus sp.]|jgi:DNA recombination protein RmuC|nr:DNA recombination protein RmuC [Ruminococcus sp.]